MQSKMKEEIITTNTRNTKDYNKLQQTTIYQEI